MTINPYERAKDPKNAKELFRWAIFEPSRLGIFGKPLPKSRKNALLVSCYSWMLPRIIFCWLGIGIIWSFLDIPFERNSALELSNKSWLDSLAFFIEYTGLFIGVVFILGALVGIIANLLVKSSSDLRVGIVSSLTLYVLGGLLMSLRVFCPNYEQLTLGLGLLGGLTTSLWIGVLSGYGYSLGGDSLTRRRYGLLRALQIGLVMGVFLGINSGLNSSGASVILMTGISAFIGGSTGFYFSIYRLIYYPFYVLSSYFNSRINFQNNPYLHDELIFLSLRAVDNQLIRLAAMRPEAAEAFVTFLLEHRPLQEKLAMKIRHGALGGKWYNSGLDPKLLVPPVIIERREQDLPSKRWVGSLTKAQEKLQDYQQQTNARLRLNSFERFLKQWEDFGDINLAEAGQWKRFYVEPIAKWRQEAREHLIVLRMAAQGIILNPYQREALTPVRNRKVFLGREELYNKLSYIIRTSDRMPLLLIQGQRRVGKTSFLNFLRQLLGDGFKVIQMDLQGASDFTDIPHWLETIRRKFNQTIELTEEKWKATEDWLQSWSELQEHLSRHSKGKGFKLVIAMDEYEALHEYGIKKDPAQGDRLLGAIRSFAQHQDRVAFLFIGVALFSELQNPRWSDYFVHSRRFRVDYLKKEDSLQLITSPYDGFPIKYHKDVPISIYQKTQGHPYLIQLICRELVEIANNENRTELGMADLDRVITQEILDEDNGAMATFWHQFCSEDTEKEIVRSIIRKQVKGSSDFLRKLKRHGFIIEENDSYKMRVPLFEKWVRTFHM